MKVSSAAAILFTALASPHGEAQIVVPGAEKDKINILRTGTSIDIELSQAKIGFTWVKEIVSSCGEKPSSECGSPTRDHTDITLTGSVTLKDGKRTIISGGEITPGYELSGAVSHYWESDQGGYFALYAPLQGKFVETKSATFSDGVATVSDRTTRTLGSGAGLIRAFSEDVAVGLSLGVQRVWNSPALQKTQQVCVATKEGLDKDGHSVTAAKCAERYVDPLVDETLWQPRAEMVIHFKRKRAQAQSYGVVASLSGSKRSGSPMAYNAAIGPTLHPAGSPGLVSAAVLLTLSDFTDASHRDLTFKDKFSVRLFVALPLTLF